MPSNSRLLDALQSGTPTIAGNAAHVLSRAAGLLRTLVDTVVGARRRAAERHQLARFDDRTLRDIGLCRGDIPRLVRERLQDQIGRSGR